MTKTMFSVLRPAVLAVACIQLFAAALYAGEIRVMTSGAFAAAYLELIPQFERTTKERIVTAAKSMGIGPESIPRRLQRGELVDVVIVDEPALNNLIKEGMVVAGSGVALARSTIGMAVQSGAPKPDISSSEALKHALLQAKSIAYSSSVSGVYLSTELFQRLGIADQIAAKSHKIEREPVGSVVARGEAEIGFQQVSELFPIQGIEYVGPLPAEVQKATVFAAGVATGSKNPDAARALIRFLASTNAAVAIAKSGMKPFEPHETLASAPAAFHLLETTIDDVQAALKAERITCRELVDLYLKRIAAYNRSGPGLNAVQTINPRALQEAERLDAAFRTSGPVGILHCIPVLVKDQLDTTDTPTTYGSAVFMNFVPQRDATVVARLRKAGAIVLAKATMGELASGIAGSASGPIRNAYDPRRHASGSSGGTGSGVAANFATAGIGEDTLGSVRGPAAVNSLVGLRPTVPLVSRYGMFPARPSTSSS